MTRAAGGTGLARRRQTPAGAAALVLLLFVAAVAACGTGAGTSPSASGAAGTTPAPASAAVASPTPTPTIAPPAALVVDGTLLDVLPAKVGDTEMTPDPENAAQLISDPTLGTTASGLALARYAKGDEIMVVSVVQLRPEIFSEGFFDGWRADYDASACQPAGGATGTEQVVTIGTNQVHVGTCAGGAATYHAHLAGDILVSAIAVGQGSLGHDVMAGLQP